MKIELISTDDLNKDRDESLVDISNCENAIAQGIEKYIGGLVSDRLEVNKKIVDKIDVELAKRKLD